jgi:hypothetical protein
MRILALGATLAASVLVSGLSPGLAWAGENFAILVGASTYPNLDQRFWLKGPANDIDLVAHYLSRESPVPFPDQNVTVLADGIEGSPAPTLAAIRGAFAALEGRVQAGDFVYLHFSGHGSQAPAKDPDSELDGLDELFLPVDIGPWNDSVGAVENALVDDEIGQLIDGLRAKGAMVWAVFDSCHSGTATRAAPTGDDEVLLRKLDPSALGVPDDRMAEAESQSRALPNPRVRPDSPLGKPEGGLVAFFAAQTNETTPEKRMPKGKTGRRAQGVFTYVLFETLARNPGITYRQLGQEVLRRYAVDNIAQSTPMFEGDLDSVVFSGTSGTPVAQWPLEVADGTMTIPAGMLHNLSEGAELKLYGAASDADDAALGTFRVASADTFSSVVEPLSGLSDIPRGAYLRQVATAFDFSLTVALPEGSGDPTLDGKLAEALAILQAEADGARVQFVPAGAPADIRLAVLPDSRRPDAVWLLPASGLLDEDANNRTPSVGIADKSADELALILEDSFQHVARALNLLRIGAGFGGTGLDVDVSLQTRNKQDKTLRALDAVSVPRLVPGDEVHVLATNNTDTPVDVNVLYVGSDYSISHFFSGRMQPGDSLKKGLLRITDDAFGRDRVILVLSPAKPQSIVENLAFMAQDELPTTRGSGASKLASAFAEAGFGATTRAAMALDDDEEGPLGSVLQFEIDTVPATK